MLRPILISLAVLMLVASCSQLEQKRNFFDGSLFRASAKKVDKDRAEFLVTVSRASQTLKGARQAGDYEATRYCIQRFGTSDIAWAAGSEPEAISQVTAKDTLVLRGTCKI